MIIMDSRNIEETSPSEDREHPMSCLTFRYTRLRARRETTRHECFAACRIDNRSVSRLWANSAHPIATAAILPSKATAHHHSNMADTTRVLRCVMPSSLQPESPMDAS